MDFSPSSECLTLEALIDGVFRSPSFDDSVGHFRGGCLGNFVIRVNEIDDVELCSLELRCIKAPFLQLVKEIFVHAPVLKSLEITIKPCPRICTYIVDMHFFSSPGEKSGCGKTGKASAHDVDSRLVAHGYTHGGVGFE